MLRELARLGAHATFFVIAPRALAFPEVVRAIRAGGHAVELHCWTHRRHTARERHAVEDDTDRALEALGGLGIAPTLWRTPWGDEAGWTGEVAAARGLRLVGWTADTHDWRGDSAEQMLAAVEADLEAGGSVLMHDGLGPGARRADCLQTLRLLDPLCRVARARGWSLEAMTGPAVVA